MTGNRMKHTIRLCMIWNVGNRTKYLKTHHVFHSMGENCSIMMRIVPLYPELISVGNNVNLASNVHFHTHDGLNLLLNKMQGENKKIDFAEGLGCIKIGNNVSIGAHSIINYGVQIGNNVIISAGSVVSNDIPDNSVVKGNPAEVVCSFKDYKRVRMMKKFCPDELRPKIMGRDLEPELVEWMWKDFEEMRKIKTNKEIE